MENNNDLEVILFSNYSRTDLRERIVKLVGNNSTIYN